MPSYTRFTITVQAVSVAYCARGEEEERPQQIPEKKKPQTSGLARKR
ncbi:MAG: hypothetical protein IPG74_05620 [Flavobacteriales bacterium]|nr:hypothetical protein [Flavobacteriales bacterium]